MDRTKRRPTQWQEVVSEPSFDIDSASFSTTLGDCSCDFPHAIFAPLHYESKYAYPLIVWLHGPGDCERQLLRMMPIVSMRNYVAVAPRGMLTPGSGSAERDCYQWQQTAEHTEQAEQRIFGCLEAVRQKFHIAAHRVFLAGFDCGGTMAFRVALNHPNRFAGVLSFCGQFPASQIPFGQNPFGRLAAARHLPVLLAGGRDSSVYPPETACSDLRLFHTAGMSITLRQYPCCQELAPQMLRDMDRWIIEQIAALSESSTESDTSWSRRS